MNILLLFFSRHNRFAETHSYYQITDRLLAAGDYECQLIVLTTFSLALFSEATRRLVAEATKQTDRINAQCISLTGFTNSVRQRRFPCLKSLTLLMIMIFVLIFIWFFSCLHGGPNCERQTPKGRKRFPCVGWGFPIVF